MCSVRYPIICARLWLKQLRHDWEVCTDMHHVLHFVPLHLSTSFPASYCTWRDVQQQVLASICTLPSDQIEKFYWTHSAVQPRFSLSVTGLSNII